MSAEGAARPRASDWRSLIGDAVSAIWPGLHEGALWVEAQVHTESLGDPRAVSPVGALGLLQLMPATAAELGVTSPLDPTQNLSGGVRYLRQQYDRLEEIPEHFDRLCWSFASYNAGRGYINRALGLAEMDKRLPGADQWWKWDLSWRYLAHRDGAVRDRWCDYRQVVDYVGRIKARAYQIGVVADGVLRA